MTLGVSARNTTRPPLRSSTVQRSILTSSSRAAPHTAGLTEVDTSDEFKAMNPISLSKPDFDDPRSAHGSKSTSSILRALAVFQICRIRFLVKNADTLLNISSKVFGTTITNRIMKHTFFRHFCAGEDSVGMMPVIDMLKKNNIYPILDYAAENEADDDNNSQGILSSIGEGGEGIFSQPPFNQPARTYDYKSELDCDDHVEIFKSCIRSVQDVSHTNGFAALKVTALGNPELLERMSDVIVEVKRLFAKFDEKNCGFITRAEFIKCYETNFVTDDDNLEEVIETLDPNNTGMIDYIAFAKMFTPYELPMYTQKCRDIGPLALVTPSNEEIALMKKMSERLHTLAEEAEKCGTKLLIDAEHMKYQPAIDSLVLELQQKFNNKETTKRPVIFNTYQCYLKDMPERMLTDLKRAERFSFHFAAKLVRGAYMVHERKRAKQMNYPSPIHDTAMDTHKCYDQCIEILLRHRYQNGPGLEVMIATHNKQSIEKAVELMNELNFNPSDGCIHFAQLYGMSDNLTFTLGKHGYNAFKYLPYGQVHEVMPYLLRRAQENGDMLGNSGSEISLLQKELKNRFLGK
eukprot:CAMPEP_0171345142 /NCGR_PEP_ID=MMETSP0878-20121228/20908_1 /TAXON_ID=67004 /ORGANISM="Thalassiosira weissflogii, Strain CCMP1336" /LENGTH=575 /DNA_ID=CAMNT_0011848487 /DNA_START=334 /DNA_END=2061 /DNA_ORIENTATION=+